MKFSDKIRIIRKARGFSQEGLGEKLSRTSEYGISRQSLSDWENGKTDYINWRYESKEGDSGLRTNIFL